MLRRALCLVGLLFAGATSGCSIAIIDPAKGDEASVNRCESNLDCASGTCAAGTCRAREGRFEALLFEVLPPVSAANGAGDRRFVTLTGIPRRGGTLSIDLPAAARVTGNVRFAIDPACDPAAPLLELPVDMSFVPSELALGLEARSLTTSTPVNTEGRAIGEFELSLAPGEYDVYVAPRADAPRDTRCPIVPQLYRHLGIGGGAQRFELQALPPASLGLRIAWPATASSTLTGWTLDVVDAASGRSVAEPVTLGSATDGGYVAKLWYSPVVSGRSFGAELGTELVRLTPPEGVVAPTMVWERAALELFNAGEALIDWPGQLPTPVSFGARVVDDGGAPVAGASVSLVATEFEGIAKGTLASYSVRRALTDANGAIEVVLLPGDYRVYAVPPAESGLGARETTWSASRAPVQSGQQVVLGRPIDVVGNVAVGWGPRELRGAPVHAVPTPLLAEGAALDDLLARRPFVPRASVADLDPAGAFALPVDPASYHVSVRPTTESGFAWLVRPNVKVVDDFSQFSLGALELPLPVMYDLDLRVDGESLGSAVVRTYLFTDAAAAIVADPDAALLAVQVGESRADSSGRARILVPASLD